MKRHNPHLKPTASLGTWQKQRVIPIISWESFLMDENQSALQLIKSYCAARAALLTNSKVINFEYLRRHRVNQLSCLASLKLFF